MSWISKKISDAKTRRSAEALQRKAEKENRKKAREEQREQKRIQRENRKKIAEEQEAIKDLSIITSIVDQLGDNITREAYNGLLERKNRIEIKLKNSADAAEIQETARKKFERADQFLSKQEREAAMEELKALPEKAEGIQKGSSRDDYFELLKRKENLMDTVRKKTEDGKDLSDEEKAAFGAADKSLENAIERIKNGEKERKAVRQTQKKSEALKILARHKGKPLETLLLKVQKMGKTTQSNGAQGNNPPSTTQDGSPLVSNPKWTHGGNLSRKNIFFQKLGLHDLRKKTALEVLKNWGIQMRNQLKKMKGDTVETSDTATDVIAESTGMAADIDDSKDVNNVLEEILEADTNGTSITSAAAAGIGGTLKCILFIKDMISERKKDVKAAGTINHDAYDRWVLAKPYLKQLLEIFDSVKNTFAPLTKTIPLFNSISSLVIDGLKLFADILMVSSAATNRDLLKQKKKDIYRRIQAKQEKYGVGGRSEDQKAFDSYTLESGLLTEWKIEKKRKILLKNVTEDVTNRETKINMVDSSNLRSRNDSQYRNAQYGLGKRIGGLKVPKRDNSEENETPSPEKSRKRQLEALQLMEEYREIDKAQKKMDKALKHSAEDILKGAGMIISNGLKLAGEVVAASGVGAGAGAASYAAGMATGIAISGYGLARKGGSGVYTATRILTGTADNKATTREDMAISIIEKMEDITTSCVWKEDVGFNNANDLITEMNKDKEQYREVVRQGRSVEHLESLIYGGLETPISNLINSSTKKDLKEKIAESFSQD